MGRKAFRESPALENTIFLEAKVKVMPSRPMLLHHKDRQPPHLRFDKGRGLRGRQPENL
jgi:hypothetical protein